ncbi:hypothetical protein BJF82_00755 [Kytococcus sp. CUA-901]|nr:hypothetical protein BJF82_00755 [Kytococcus sp. CUA-901]
MPSSRPASSPFHDRLEPGRVYDASPLAQGDISMFDAVTLRPLEEMLVPEHPRSGETDPAECWHCQPAESTIWQDDLWQLRSGGLRTGLPFLGGFAPREHVLLEDAPLEVLAALGPLMQRLSNAVKQVPGVARCHFGRWNDGSAHLHLHALARPAGMMRARGVNLAYWDDVLPPLEPRLQAENIRIVARAMAEGGGKDLTGRGR